MKKLKYIFAFVLAFCALSSFARKSAENNSSVYAFGFSASFADSIVYFSEVQRLDGVKLEKKTKFMENRSSYSYQLKNYLEDKLGLKNRTCVIIYAPKKANAEKEFIKLRRKYTAMKNLQIKYLNASDFQFTKIVEEVDSEDAQQ